MTTTHIFRCNHVPSQRYSYASRGWSYDCCVKCNGYICRPATAHLLAPWVEVIAEQFAHDEDYSRTYDIPMVGEITHTFTDFYGGRTIVVYGRETHGRGDKVRETMVWVDVDGVQDGGLRYADPGDPTPVMERALKAARERIDVDIANDELRPILASMCRVAMPHTIARLQRAASPVVGSIVWVHAMGAIRQGKVTKIGPKRIEVAYVTPNRPDVVRRKSVPSDEVLELI